FLISLCLSNGKSRLEMSGADTIKYSQDFMSLSRLLRSVSRIPLPGPAPDPPELLLAPPTPTVPPPLPIGRVEEGTSGIVPPPIFGTVEGPPPPPLKLVSLVRLCWSIFNS